MACCTLVAIAGAPVEETKSYEFEFDIGTQHRKEKKGGSGLFRQLCLSLEVVHLLMVHQVTTASWSASTAFGRPTTTTTSSNTPLTSRDASSSPDAAGYLWNWPRRRVRKLIAPVWGLLIETCIAQPPSPPRTPRKQRGRPQRPQPQPNRPRPRPRRRSEWRFTSSSTTPRTRPTSRRTATARWVSVTQAKWVTTTGTVLTTSAALSFTRPTTRAVTESPSKSRQFPKYESGQRHESKKRAFFQIR